MNLLGFPWCGSLPVVVCKALSENNLEWLKKIKCKNPDCFFGPESGFYFDSDTKAIEAWNNRNDFPASDIDMSNPG